METIYVRPVALRTARVALAAAAFCSAGMTAQSDCANPAVLDLFRHEVAYQRTEELNPLKDLRIANANVWQRGPDTAFYIRDPLSGFSPTIRLVYSFSEEGFQGYFGCPIAQDWKACVQASFQFAGPHNQPQTCTKTIDLSGIPAWEPSPDSPEKRKVAAELLAEIEAQWSGAQEIVVRDFNLKDPQITIYLKLPDGDYVQGCSFHAATQPQCTGWHLFGMVPNSKIKQWVFEKPYRLK